VPEVYAVVWRYGESVPELVRGERWRDGGTGERLVLWAWHNRPGSADVDDVIDRYVPLTWDGSPT